MKKQLSPQQHTDIAVLGYKDGPFIGDLIEFLDEHDYWTINKSVLNLGMIPRETICDELWEAVKEVLGEL